MPNKEKIIDTFGIGFILWLAGYLSSMLLYFSISHDMLGWILFVIFTPITIYVAYWRFHRRSLSMRYYVKVAIVWTLLAVAFDYIFIVMLFNSQNYYQSDIFLYYITTFLIPLGTGLKYAAKR